jgi:exonuclease III
MYPNTVTVGDFSTPLSPIDRSSRLKKIIKETLKLSDTIDQMDLTDIYRVFHSATAQYAFFSATHGTFSKIDHLLGLFFRSIFVKQVLTNTRKPK